jgi:hypothetical protein
MFKLRTIFGHDGEDGKPMEIPTIMQKLEDLNRFLEKMSNP